jgi:hypothetical protein
MVGGDSGVDLSNGGLMCPDDLSQAGDLFLRPHVPLLIVAYIALRHLQLVPGLIKFPLSVIQLRGHSIKLSQLFFKPLVEPLDLLPEHGDLLFILSELSSIVLDLVSDLLLVS